MLGRLSIGALVLVGALAAHAAGPSAIAKSDRAHWPDPIDSQAGFDRASRGELLAYGHALAETDDLSDEAWRARLHLKEIDHAHLLHMQTIYWQRIAHNYALASAHCTPSEPLCPKAASTDAFKQVSRNFGTPADPHYQLWFDEAIAFHRLYLDEQLRLAALFPHVSSEVDTFNSREISGNELADREFFLTFDDGPTSANGTTEKLLAVLREAHLDATFFVLGNNLEAREKPVPGAATVQELYRGMCVGMHGWEHKSHSAWTEWQSSITRTTSLVKDSLKDDYVPLFRPPYGQRKADSDRFFAENGLRVALWNIDSQDWNNGISAAEAGQRTLTLMLLWRRGIILFHDIHNKAPSAVPYLLTQTKDSGVRWSDCRNLAATSAMVP